MIQSLLIITNENDIVNNLTNFFHEHFVNRLAT